MSPSPIPTPFPLPLVAAPALLLALLLAASPAALRAQDQPQLPPGARVVLVGPTWLERDRERAFLEARLVSAWPDRDILTRNIAWSADTLFGDSRAGFETAREGYERLRAKIRELAPTHLVVAYGTAEALDPAIPATLFAERLEASLDLWTRDLAPNPPFFILVTPPSLSQSLRRLRPDTERDRRWNEIAEVVREIARERRLPLVDLAAELPPDDRLREPDAWNLSLAGHRAVAQVFDRALALPPAGWELRLEYQSQPPAVRVQNARAVRLPTPPVVEPSSEPAPAPAPVLAFDAASERLAPPWAGLEQRPALAVSGLPPGRYRLLIDQHPVAAADAPAWARGVPFRHIADDARFSALRAAIVERNALFFNAWRPQNDTYLFGFRKHEQGVNAVEIERFLQLVPVVETRVAELRRPALHRFELRPETSETPRPVDAP